MRTLYKRNVILRTFIGTDVPELFLDFRVGYEPTQLAKFDLPRGFRYQVTMGIGDGVVAPLWISIVKPIEVKYVLYLGGDCLPDVRFDYAEDDGTLLERNISLLDFFRRYVLFEGGLLS